MKNIQVRRKFISVLTLGMLIIQFFPLTALGVTMDAEESSKFTLTGLYNQTFKKWIDNEKAGFKASTEFIKGTKPYSFVKNFVDDEIERENAAKQARKEMLKSVDQKIEQTKYIGDDYKREKGNFNSVINFGKSVYNYGLSSLSNTKNQIKTNVSALKEIKLSLKERLNKVGNTYYNTVQPKKADDPKEISLDEISFGGISTLLSVNIPNINRLKIENLKNTTELKATPKGDDKVEIKWNVNNLVKPDSVELYRRNNGGDLEFVAHLMDDDENSYIDSNNATKGSNEYYLYAPNLEISGYARIATAKY